MHALHQFLQRFLKKYTWDAKPVIMTQDHQATVQHVMVLANRHVLVGVVKTVWEIVMVTVLVHAINHVWVVVKVPVLEVVKIHVQEVLNNTQ